jgi:hypothetical protein
MSFSSSLLGGQDLYPLWEAGRCLSPCASGGLTEAIESL